jgi:NADH-quinone oxidoreductase subunit G
MLTPTPALRALSLGTDNIDFRARANSEEEREFLAAYVAGTPIKVEYADLEKAPIVLLVTFEPEDESPIVFLRLRKAASNASGKSVTIASVAAGASQWPGQDERHPRPREAG